MTGISCFLGPATQPAAESAGHVLQMFLVQRSSEPLSFATMFESRRLVVQEGSNR